MSASPHAMPIGQRSLRYEQLVELAPDGIVVHDGERILWANQAAVRLMGASRVDELVGQAVDRFIRPPHLKAIARALVGDTHRSAPAPPVRDTLHRLDGDTVEVEVRAQGFLEDGLPLVHLVIRDITERLAAQALTSELAAQLQATQRLEAVGTLAGGVAHEVNNMLQVILGFGIPLLEDRALDPQALASLSEIITAANHAAGITRQLLEFSRHAEHHPQLVDLSAMVRQLMPVIRRLAGEHRRLEVSAVGSHLVWVDPGQLEQVLVNLMVNARHATVDGDTIAVVATETVLATETLDISGHPIAPGRYGTLEIRDTGSGMDAATSARIFEPFFTTKPIGSGTGLGLAAVAGIMAQNGGRITVRSAPGVGTTFSLYFLLASPRQEASTERQAHVEPPSEQHAPVSGTHSILVVDDEPSVCTVTGRLLQRAGYTVTLANSGQAALDLIARTGPPALLLTDLGMPGMSGRELARHVRAQWPQVPVVFMSGYAAGAFTYDDVDEPQYQLLEKPFDPAALLSTVALVLAAVQPA